MKGIRFALMVGALLLTLAACDSAGGELRIAQAGEGGGYKMAFSQWSGKNRQELSLEAGDELQVEALWEQGELSLGITGQNGGEAYQGKILATGLFTVKVAEGGTYEVHIAGSQATGSVLIRNLGGGR